MAQGNNDLERTVHLERPKESENKFVLRFNEWTPRVSSWEEHWADMVDNLHCPCLRRIEYILISLCISYFLCGV